MPFFFLNSEYTSAVGFSSSSMAPCRAEENLKLPAVHNTNYKVCQTLEQLVELSVSLQHINCSSFLGRMSFFFLLLLLSFVYSRLIYPGHRIREYSAFMFLYNEI